MNKKYDYLIVGSGLFGGRLAVYKYYDMAPIIEKASVSFINISVTTDVKRNVIGACQKK